MTDRRLILLGRVVAVATLACGVLAAIVLVASDEVVPSLGPVLQELSGTVLVPVIVLIALPKVPRNGSVWAFAIVGLSLGLVVLADAVAFSGAGISSEDVNNMAVTVAPADLPLSAAIGITVALSAWIPSFVLLPTLVLLLFPDGRFPDPQRIWRRVGQLTIAVATVGMLAIVWQYPVRSTTSYARLSADISPASVIAGAASLLFIILAVVSIVGYALKWKRAKGDVRLQYRWVGFAFFAFAIWSIATVVLSPIIGSAADNVKDVVSWVTIVFLAVAYAVSILKYRLYGIDVVISKTVTYGVLAAFITGVYALLVVGVGRWFGGSEEPSLALSILAVALIAVAFEPLRSRVQRAANRLVFGNRASPYEVLATATRRLAGAGTAVNTLDLLTELVSEGTGAVSTVLWVRVGGHLHPHSATPIEALGALTQLDILDDAIPDVPGQAVVPVIHHDRLLGVLTIDKPRGESVTGADEKVLTDVAAGLGLLLRNIGLNAELAERAEQLRQSRRRLVATQDAERHRLERNLHDGAQQQVVALKVKLGIARTLAEREGAESVAAIVTDLAKTTQEAVDTMRAVAHGIYPPLLEAEGLDSALRAVGRTFPLAIDLEFTNLGRYQRSLEESLYFCLVEIITRAVEGGASTLSVSLIGSADAVEFTIRHDGIVQDLVVIEDRVDAMDGTLRIADGTRGASVTGTLPIAESVLERA